MNNKHTLIRLTITFWFLVVFLGSVYSQSLLNQDITLNKGIYSPDELVEELIEVHNIRIGFGALPKKEEIKFPSRKLKLKEVLDELIKNSSFTYQLLDRKVLIVKKGNQSGKATIRGFIKDAESGEALIGATIYDQISNSGVVSNNYGFYSLTIPKGPVELTSAYLGFENQSQTIELENNQSLDFEMKPEISLLEEVTVEGYTHESIELTPQMSTISLTSKQIEAVPMILGEYDILKAIQLLPGIQGGTEGSSGIYVRGGGPDQNLILLDGVPVYNTSHMFGFFSVFNGDAVNNIDVIKGGFPARYGGRLSSVIDISMKEGNNNALSGKGSIGLLSSKFLLEGPINDKTSFIVTGRRTYFDLLAIPFNIGENLNYYFYDFNAKINHRFSDRDRVFISFYGGNDAFDFASENTYYLSDTPTVLTKDTELGWGNIVSVVRWNHIFNPKLFGAFSTSFSRFRFKTTDERFSTATEQLESLDYTSGIRDAAFRASFEYLMSPDYEIRFGGSAIAHRFNTGVVNLSSVEDQEPSDREQIDAREYAVYVENDFNVGKKMRLNAGLHSSIFNVDNENYFSLQPRISARFLLPNSLSIKASYSEMQQFIHLLTNSGVGLPTDLWVPSTEQVKPQFSRQLAIGAAKELGLFEISLEGYYKEMNNLIEYQNGASYLSRDTNWENKIEKGKGTSYGAELLIQKRSGAFTGWLGYTWSKTTRQFDDLNFGETFPFKYDRRHDISTTGSYKLTENCTISGTWVFGTGTALTMPVTKYLASGHSRLTGGSPNNIFDLVWLTYATQIENFDQRNNYRMRDYHRLDLSISWSKEKKRGTRTWTIGVYNAYSRLNSFFVFLDEEFTQRPGPDGTEYYYKPVLKQSTLFPAIPFVNYSFKF